MPLNHAEPSYGPYDPLEALLSGAYQGNLDVVRTAIDVGVDVNGTLESSPYQQHAGAGKDPALVVAVQRGHTAIVEVLINAGANLNSLSQDRSALHYVAGGPDNDSEPAEDLHRRLLDCLQLLLDAGADVNVCAEGLSGVTPLLHAVRHGNVEAVRVLLARGADVNVTNARGDTPLHLAASAGSVEMTELLIAADADVNAYNANGQTPLHRTTDPDAEGPVDKIIGALVRAGADVNRKEIGKYTSEYTPLELAASRGNQKAIAAFVKALPDDYLLTAPGRSLILKTISDDNTDALKTILDSCPDKKAVLATEGAYSPLHLAAGIERKSANKTNKGENLRLVLGATHGDLDQRDCNGLAPIHHASDALCSENLDVLLSAGAHPDITISPESEHIYVGCTAVSIIAGDMRTYLPKHYLKAMRTLMRCNADVNVVDNDGYTPLMRSLTSGDGELRHGLSRELLEYGADPNLSGEESLETPLSIAIDQKDIDNVRGLLSAGASCDDGALSALRTLYSNDASNKVKKQRREILQICLQSDFSAPPVSWQCAHQGP